MASYRLEWRSSTRKDIRRVSPQEAQRIIHAAEALTQNPFPPGVQKLSGSEHSHRIRVGDYRVIYEVFSEVLVIEVVRIGHRKDVYR